MKFKYKLKLSAAAVGATLLISGLSMKPAMACSGIDQYLGSMCVFAGNFNIRTYAFAQGQLLPISSNTALFSLLGTIYGGDGRTTFALPDTRGRALIGFGQGPGLSNYRQGQKGGVETVTLTTAQMPAHNHSASTSVTANATATANANSRGNSDNPAGNVWARKGRDTIYSPVAPDVTMSTDAIDVSVTATAGTTINVNGGGTPHENRMPYMVINWLIAIQGIYPSRS